MAGGLAFVEILMMIIMIPTYVHMSISFTAAAQMQSLCFSLEGVRVQRFGSYVVE